MFCVDFLPASGKLLFSLTSCPYYTCVPTSPQSAIELNRPQRVKLVKDEYDILIQVSTSKVEGMKSSPHLSSSTSFSMRTRALGDVNMQTLECMQDQMNITMGTCIETSKSSTNIMVHSTKCPKESDFITDPADPSLPALI